MLSQPLGCVQCQKRAPCEQVYPVAATVHSAEALTTVLWPPSVPVTARTTAHSRYDAATTATARHFQDSKNKVKTMVFNPGSIRSSSRRHEKVYLLRSAHQEAKLVALNEKRTLRDGDIQTACSQACPSNAIVFGDLNDKNAESRSFKPWRAPTRCSSN